MTALTRARIAELVALLKYSEAPVPILAAELLDILAAAQFVAELAERRCRCDEIATCDFGDRCDACRARALVTPDAAR